MMRLRLFLCCVGGFAACSSEGRIVAPPAPQVVASIIPTKDTECATDQETCLRWGQPGVCLQNRCVLRNACSFAQDCDDLNPCTRETCERGECRVVLEREVTSCSLDGVVGSCRGGECLAPPPASCSETSECEDASEECYVATCAEGRCRFYLAPEGSDCLLSSGVPGTCVASKCEIPDTDVARSRKCRTVRTVFGSYEDCTTRAVRIRLSQEDLAAEAAKIEKKIADGVLYDVMVSLVPLADGGYNILVFNRRSRGTVQGLVDPSFVAFEVGGFTSRSRWRSRTLQIWLNPYSEGWQISTEGGRRALRRGRAASRLGFLGVVDVRAFRSWLQRAFEPIVAPAMDVSSVSPGVSTEAGVTVRHQSPQSSEPTP
jgi:hypothetical protein